MDQKIIVLIIIFIKKTKEYNNYYKNYIWIPSDELFDFEKSEDKFQTYLKINRTMRN